MSTLIQNLISRMSDDSYRVGEKTADGFTYESDKTVSGAAYEEARQLSNSEYFNELYDFIDTAADEVKKAHAYFILGHNAKNTKDLKATGYLIKRLSAEKSKIILVTILDRLAELYKPGVFDISQIYKLTDSHNGQIRDAAFQALTNNENKVEDFLIDKLITTNKKTDIRPLLSSLMYVGTAKAIPHVKKHLKNRQPFIKSYSINVLTVIMLRENFTFEDIQKKLKVSRDFVQTHFDRLDTLSRPG
jgi:hypothetical protein